MAWIWCCCGCGIGGKQATAWIGLLAWELPYAVGAALKRQKRPPPKKVNLFCKVFIRSPFHSSWLLCHVPSCWLVPGRGGWALPGIWMKERVFACTVIPYQQTGQWWPDIKNRSVWIYNHLINNTFARQSHVVLRWEQKFYSGNCTKCVYKPNCSSHFFCFTFVSPFFVSPLNTHS